MPNTLKLSGPIIHTPDQRLRVFISSTIGELANERLAAKKKRNPCKALKPIIGRMECGTRTTGRSWTKWNAFNG